MTTICSSCGCDLTTEEKDKKYEKEKYIPCKKCRRFTPRGCNNYKLK